MSTIYDVLRRPLVTEKSNYQVSKLHQYVFEVADNATRTMVKDAVEKLFEVNVVRVNIINVPAKRTRRATQPPLSSTRQRIQESHCYPGNRRRIPILRRG